MKLDQLLTNQRYLFHFKNINDQDDAMFRGNFIKLCARKTSCFIVVNGYHSKKYPRENVKTFWAIDTNMISNVESLTNLVDSNCVLPDDVLLEIDNYY
jgi:hypothetical protein